MFVLHHFYLLFLFKTFRTRWVLLATKWWCWLLQCCQHCVLNVPSSCRCHSERRWV